MRDVVVTGAAIASLIYGTAKADTSINDEVFANVALGALHELAAASTKLEQASNESDEIGCESANKEIQEAAHEALENMHYMSFRPSGAIDAVSRLLRFYHLRTPSACFPDESGTSANLGVQIAGQAIMSLRWDYAIGNGHWYRPKLELDSEGGNPLRYAQSLVDQDYSWVSMRPKDMVVMVETDWKAEMASHQIYDSSIRNSGDDLQAVEVDYRKNSGDKTTIAYFYRTKSGADAAAQTENQRIDMDKKVSSDQKATDFEWAKKLASLPYMVANNDIGFKLIYMACRDGKFANGETECKFDNSIDWSDDPKLPYRWFSNIKTCEDAQSMIRENQPTNIELATGDALTSDCVPARRPTGSALSGYQMVIEISAPGAAFDDLSYASLRGDGFENRRVFHTYNDCEKKVDRIYAVLQKALAVADDGSLLSDKSKGISLVANCVREY